MKKTIGDLSSENWNTGEVEEVGTFTTACDAYKQTRTQHLICAWNNDSNELYAELLEQEEKRHQEDAEYKKKFIAHTICDFHKRIMEESI